MIPLHIIWQVVAAILITQGEERLITDISNESHRIVRSFPVGAYLLHVTSHVCAEGCKHCTQMDRVFVLDNRIAVVDDKTSIGAILEALQEPVAVE